MDMKNIFKTLVILNSLFLLFCCAGDGPATAPPRAERILHTENIHGTELLDHYHWLKEKDTDRVLQYLDAENKYTDMQMENTLKLQDILYNEMIGRLQEDDISAPVRKGNYYYYQRTEKGKDYPVYCRKYESMEAPEEILLDLNDMAPDHDYIDMGDMAVSPCHKYLAYTIDNDGSEIYTLFIKDLHEKALLDDLVHNAGRIVWNADSSLIFYNSYNEAQRSDKIYMHRIGTPQSIDRMVYYEEDDSFYAYISKSRSEKYFFIHSSNATTSEVYYLDVSNPENDFELLLVREPGIEYTVDHINSHFYILTNDEAKNFKVMKADKESINDKSLWTELVGHMDNTTVRGMELFDRHIVIRELSEGLTRFRTIEKNTDIKGYIEFPEDIYFAAVYDNPEPNTNIFRFMYSSMIQPDTVYDYNMDTGELIKVKQLEVKGEFVPSLYKTYRLWANVPGSDEIKIPISIVYNKDLVKKDGKSPLYLYTYGSYGAVEQVKFFPGLLSLLDRGIIYAVAHVRGGGELGTEWYESGKLLNRKNTFDDLISCAMYLVNENYTGKGNIIIHGISAGGGVVSAAANMRPDLFLAVIADVPFVDILNTMLDPSLPLTVIEYDEWGDPNDPVYFNYIRSYCPYQNLKNQDYPHFLITAGYNDPRVGYWEPAKFAAKLREMKTCDSIVLLKTHMGAGHFGSTGRYEYFRELAFYYAYIIDTFGRHQF